MKDTRILGIPFIECDICGKQIRESEATPQRGLRVCSDDVDVMDHEGEN